MAHDSHLPLPPVSDVPRPYAAPALTDLGSIGAVTAGPDNGSIDQLVGGGGGFRQADPTS